jgi:uridine kinase
MAIRVLLDHGVKEDHIVLVTFLVAPSGVSVLHRTFPKVRVVTGAVDGGLKEVWLERVGEDAEGLPRKIWTLEPGMGQIGENDAVLPPTAR